MRNCKDCGKPYKPTGKAGRCLPCRRAWDKEWRARRKAAGRPVIPTPVPNSYHRAYAKRPKARKSRAERTRRYVKVPHLRQHYEARAATIAAIRKGTLLRQPCEVCGKPRAHAHHDDYSKPLAVRWLCQTHHREHHESLKTKAEGRS